ncbi:hypothetical protein SMACR_12611 [Sordaria macrospora]|uniref:WGS project CABT00000000 data, contig 2.13 n=2 Tax=Sordaria macrospora TaxID=5147 RepID=F7VYK3_SORMK|nr:uncharacterized protein SMAC_12611 [Sordaria macrospora k-hell]KAA8630571.1 hypothetical protein SMACR_12611 [Sordaria macrospora]WPJ63039.1 hypothetical protein SMAC4_12611 [Sordaria macrospora]CCC10598.1 unnamed protein product [Sordaria macrospora k-hell]
MEPSRLAPIQPYRVVVHNYPSHDPESNRFAQAYEYETNRHKRTALIFVGGLGDGPHGIPYVKFLADSAIAGESDYAVYEPRLSSAFSAWGYGSLSNDVKEISALVKYLRHRKTFRVDRIVLMGHSTGCQDAMYYATHGAEMGLEKIDAFILQGPVSDREAILAVFEEASPGKGQARMDLSVRVAQKMMSEGTAHDCMPREWLPKEFWTSPVSAYRWNSLASFGGDDDYFSSDLPDEKLAEIWGKVSKPVLVLPSENDEHVPDWIDVVDMLDKWKSFCKEDVISSLSGLIPEADHRVEYGPAGEPADRAQGWLCDRVHAFFKQLERQWLDEDVKADTKYQ